MAKRSGGTRITNSQSMYGSGSPINEGLSAAAFDRMVAELSRDEYPEGWSDLETSQRELALMQSGFTGFADDGAENIMFPVDKDTQIRNTIDAILTDFQYGERSNSDTYITVAYKDGTKKTVGALGSEFDIPNLTSRQSSRTQDSVVRSALKVRDIAYITHNDSYRETYWVAPGNEAQIRRDTGYEKWKNGRGEKRRDYIQDDWI